MMQPKLSRALSITGTNRINSPTVEQLTIITSFCFAFVLRLLTISLFRGRFCCTQWLCSYV